MMNLIQKQEKLYPLDQIRINSKLDKTEFYKLLRDYNFFIIGKYWTEDEMKPVEIDRKFFESRYAQFEGRIIEAKDRRLVGFGKIYLTKSGVNWLHEFLLDFAEDFPTTDLFTNYKGSDELLF